MHVVVGVTVVVSDVVAAPGVPSRDAARVPPAVSTVVAHYLLSNSVRRNCACTSCERPEHAGSDSLLVTIVVLNHVYISGQCASGSASAGSRAGNASRVPSASVGVVALYSLADSVGPVGDSPEPGASNVPLNITIIEAKRVDALSVRKSSRGLDPSGVVAARELGSLERRSAVGGKAWRVGWYARARVGPSPAAGAGCVSDRAPPDTSPGSWGVQASAVPWGGGAKSVPLDNGAGAVSSTRGHADGSPVDVPLARDHRPQELREE